jgi:hypothetical protein
VNKLSWSAFAGISPATVEPPALGRFVILSLLVHFLLVVLFGNTTGTSSSPGDSMSMPLGVRLRPQSYEPGAGLRLAPGTETSSLGAALLRTLTGAKQPPAPRPRTETPPATAVPPRPAANRVEQAPKMPEAAQPLRDAAPPAQAPPIDPLPGLNFSAPEVVDKPLKPSAITPPPIERPPAPPVDLPPREVPIVPPAPIERIVASKVEQPIVPPTAPAPREVPKVPAPVAERVAPRTIEPAPMPTPEPPPTPVERIAPAVQPAPREVPVMPPASVEKVAPPSIERTLTPPVERAVREAPTAPAPAAPATPAAAPVPSGSETGAPADTMPRPRVGAPDGRDDIFRPRPEATTPATPPGPAPRINLDAVRQRAREIATEGSGSRGLFPLQIPVPAERKSKLAEGIEKAIKPDCRNAYADMGLLALPALVAGAVADVGCRW